jgi:hypothetical protein
MPARALMLSLLAPAKFACIALLKAEYGVHLALELSQYETARYSFLVQRQIEMSALREMNITHGGAA